MLRRPLPPERQADLPPGLEGLTTPGVDARRRRYGSNDVIEAAAHTWRDLLRDTARDPMLWFLLGTSVLFAAIGDTTEALVLLAALVPFVGMDAFLHRRTQASTQGLRSRLASEATLMRDGTRQVLPVAALVPGDLAEVNTGEPFPADGILLVAESAQVDESSLTGESWPVRKDALPGGADAAAATEAQWVFAGTRLLTGSARVRIVYTGRETLYGEIVRSAAGTRQGRTPLQLAIDSLVRVLVAAALVLCAVLAGVRLAQGHGVVDALISAVTLAVAALPEEFPVVFTFFLGVGVYRLARKQALVRRAVVVESIGRVSTICTDKTGTLTEGQLRVGHVEPMQGLETGAVLALAALASRAETADPLDLAILAAAGAPARPPQVVATFPFTEDRKRETVVVRAAGGLLAVNLAVTKGAPETIVALCAGGSGDLLQWRERVESLARSGHKVIAVAQRELADVDPAAVEPEEGFGLAGLIALEDPVRSGVPEAVAQCRAAGIHVLMVTGDHPATAAAIAAEIGLGDGQPRVILGAELAERLARNQDGWSRDIDVVARAVPGEKLALVRALQAAGETFAVTGDGVNDVPALQAADIGIAMGERGTRSAREAAAIVLLDDNFRSIAGAIAEGRQLFANLRLAFHYLLVVHIPLVVTAALIPLLGYPLLYLPIHVVWLELVIHPTALLVFQQLPEGPLRPRRRGAANRQVRFFSRGEWLLVLATGLVIGVVVVASYDRSLEGGYNVEHARAMALVALTLASAAVTAVLSRLATRTAQLITLATVVSTVLLVQQPRLAAWLHLEPLHADDWLVASAGALLAAAVTSLRWVPGARARPQRRSPEPALPGRQ
ncbi:MAG: cation-transporting P-type ATPase [Gammaproteobacteria bacterium]|nr:cation-transporting P-type ATPase [Gammaproteobacteria bacterium]